jgi:nucleoside-diphosphate-sugar epimerase
MKECTSSPGTTAGPSDAAEPASGRGLYSIAAHYDSSCCVLLTGATGYIGSLVLEKLLRSTTAGRIFVLLRPRRGVGPQERLAALLDGPLFHLVGPEHAARVTAVAGDILAPRLGLSDADEAALVGSVDTVVHAAAGEWLGRLQWEPSR